MTAAVAEQVQLDDPDQADDAPDDAEAQVFDLAAARPEARHYCEHGEENGDRPSAFIGRGLLGCTRCRQSQLAERAKGVAK